MKPIVTTPSGLKGYPVLSLYADGGTRLDLRDVFDHSLLEIASANCVAYCPPDCLFVENREMGNALYDAGVVTGTVDTLKWGVTEYPIMRLNPKLAAQLAEMREQFFADEEEDEE